MSGPRYQYRSLQQGEIRLLHSTIDDSDEVTWSLKTTQLDDTLNRLPMAFDALSYTWGDQAQTFSLLCDGAVLHIHHNLNEALPYLARRRPTPLPLWVDAVCINQEDVTEKDQQITRMGKIYRQADTVWAWLGVHDKSGFDLINDISRIISRLAPEERTYTPSHPLYQHLDRVELGLPDLYSPQCASAYAILRSPWFSRLWVVQEAALARRLIFLSGTH